MNSVKQCIREEKNCLEFYVANSEENLIRGVSAAETINTKETISSVEFKKQKVKEVKKKSGVKIECMGNSSGKRQGKLIRKKIGNGYQVVI